MKNISTPAFRWYHHLPLLFAASCFIVLNPSVLLAQGRTDTVFSTNSVVPNGDGAFSSIELMDHNNSGDFLFSAELTGTSNSGSNDSGLFASIGGTVFEVVREGSLAPDMNGTFDAFSDGTMVSLGNSGRVSFLQTLSDTAGGFDDNQGVFTWTNVDVTPNQLRRKRDTLIFTDYLGYFGVAVNDLDQTITSERYQSGVTDQSRILAFQSDGSVNTLVSDGMTVPDGNGVFLQRTFLSASASHYNFESN